METKKLRQFNQTSLWTVNPSSQFPKTIAIFVETRSWSVFINFYSRTLSQRPKAMERERCFEMYGIQNESR